MNNLYEFAKTELINLSYIHKESDDRPIVEEFREQILELVDTIGNSGQSGCSMSYTAKIVSDTIQKLLMMQPISPITGNDWEWFNVTPDAKDKSKHMYQNKRCPALFKDGVDGKPYYGDAITWVNKDNSNDRISGRINDIYSHQYVKSFPFTPKTFYVKYQLFENCVKKINYEDLVVVFDYYDASEECSKGYIEHA